MLMMFWTDSKTERRVQPGHSPQKWYYLSSTLFRSQSKLFAKQLTTCINRFYACINLRVVSQSAHRIKSFFPIRLGSTVLKCQKLCMRLVVGTARIFTLEKQNVDCMTEKLNILKRSRVPFMLLPSHTTSRQLVTSLQGTTLIYWQKDGQIRTVR